MSDEIQPQKAPSLNLPKGNTTCKVSIINTTCNLTVPPPTLVEPSIKGHDWLNLPTFGFLITHPSGEQVLFDLGSRTDWWNLVPHVNDVVANRVPGLNVEKDVVDILRDGGVDPDRLKALILSHWHFDHSGDLSRLALSTDVIVGPGFNERFQPGWPANENSVFHEADFKDRKVIEPPFSDDFKIGQYQAHDYMGDGSIYILNVPGHTTGHISALVRTTPETFIFMGGDVCHFTGVIRPTTYIPMPSNIPPETTLDSRFGTNRPCPCLTFTACHPNQSSPRTTPFYQCSTGEHSWYDDPKTAMVSIRALFEFDADPNVIVMIAHDNAPLVVLKDKMFPHGGDINDWKQQGYKEKLHWGFVNELPAEGVPARDTLTDGLYRGGKRVKDLGGKAV
ncbi:Cytochrome P450 monooxygenase [Pseudocercospora fuligena]|uniref:Cytochrome P450 monooxygenase n=1 Tax=Pseudocercospora fuligena TaxID=685502 RepID=A0A8H6VFR6_9PEZI|nr:Cytochrome P450 monooxygenase [Pseudocercospora fuligena]